MTSLKYTPRPAEESKNLAYELNISNNSCLLTFYFDFPGFELVYKNKNIFSSVLYVPVYLLYQGRTR